MKVSRYFGILLVLFFGVGTLRAQSYNWTTIAGLANTPAYSDGTNNAAFFNSPQGVAVDGAGNVFVADANNYIIRKISLIGTNWVTTTIAGLAGSKAFTNGTNNTARFNTITTVQIDGSGNLYVQDFNSPNYFIRKITPIGTNWVVTTLYKLWANGSGWASDPNGNYYTSSNYVIIQLSPVITNGVPSPTNFVATTLAGFPGLSGNADGMNNVARFTSPSVFGLDSTGTIYLSDVNNSPGRATYRIISPSGGNYVTTTVNVQFSEPFGGTAYPNPLPFNNLDFANNLFGSFFLNYDGLYHLLLVQAGATSASFFGGLTNSTGLAGITVGADGKVYVADNGASVIRQAVTDSLPFGALQVTLQPSDAVIAGAAWRVDAGLWQTNGATVTNLIAGSNHVLSFAPIFGWISPSNQWVTISNTATTTVTGNYIQQFGTLQVNLTPAGAIAAGGLWQVDGGNWQANGTLASGLTIGSHVVTYTNVVGWVTPTNQIVNIVPFQQTTATGIYVALGAVVVNLAPPGATNAGAQWSLDGGAGFNSGTVASNLSLGSHIISFLPAPGWVAPSNQTVTVTSGVTITNTGTYVALGAVSASINPSNVVSAGAQWQLDGGAFQNSGTVISNVTLGLHTIAYLPVLGWNTPSNQNVNVVSGQTTNVSAAYVAQGGVLVNINPTNAISFGAQWALDGGAFQNSGTTLSNLTLGAHTIAYSQLTNWITPATQVVTVVSGQTTNVTATYIALGSLQVIINPIAILSLGAAWRVDGGAWQTNTAVVTNLIAGTHTVSFTNIFGWTTPTNQPVIISLNQTTVATGIYVQQFGSVQVVFSPAGVISAGPQWQLDGGAAQGNGATITNLVVGNHALAFGNVVGWTAPTNQTVVVTLNQTARITAIYSGQGSLQVLLVPTSAVVAGAMWQVDGGGWLGSSMIVSGLTRGLHTVAYKFANGWVAPVSQSVNILASQTTVTNGFYTGLTYNFTTIAGTAGSVGSTDGTNQSALFNAPAGMVVDLNSNIFVADTGNSVIRKLMPTTNGWNVSTIAGLAGVPGNADGTNSQARFDFPLGLAVDTNGTLFVADQVNSTIRKIITDGTNWTVTTIAGLAGSYGNANGTNSAARFYYPAGIAVDPAGNVYVSDQINSIIRKLTPVSNNWAVTTIAGTSGLNGSSDGVNNAARFYGPGDLKADPSGNLFVADTGNNTIRKITPSGGNYVVTTISGAAGINGSLDGTNNTAWFDGVGGIALDALGNLFVADSYSSTIRKITPVGNNWSVNTIGGLAYNSGSTDGTNSAARFNLPFGIAVDGNGVVYVADTYNQIIRAGIMQFPLSGQPGMSIAPAGKNYSINWQGIPGLTYQVQFKTNLMQPTWATLVSSILATNVATNSLMLYLDLNATNAQRFYRIMVLPTSP